MKFKTAFDCKCSDPSSSSGSRFRQTYKRQFDEKSGLFKIVSDKKEDVYNSIQIAAEGRKLSDLVARSLRGDESAIGLPVDSFVDLTNAPKDAMEAQNLLIRSQEHFMSLPKDIRSHFSNNCSVWLKSLADGSFKEYITSRSKTMSERKAADKLYQSSKPVFTPEQLNYLKSLNNGGSSDAT